MFPFSHSNPCQFGSPQGSTPKMIGPGGGTPKEAYNFITAYTANTEELSENPNWNTEPIKERIVFLCIQSRGSVYPQTKVAAK